MSSRFPGTHEEFVETILDSVFVEEVEKAFARCPDPIPWDVEPIPKAETRAALERLYREKGWPGKPKYEYPPSWVRINQDAEIEGITKSWLYEVIKDGSLRHCVKGPELVNGGIRQVWRFDLDEAKALRAERNKKWKKMDTDKGIPPDRLEKDGWVYIRAASLEEGVRSRLGHAKRKGSIRAFVAQYERHALYVEEGDVRRETAKYRQRKATIAANKKLRKDIVVFTRRAGPVHLQGIVEEFGLKEGRVRTLLAKFVEQGKMERVQPGWYAVPKK